MCNAVYKRDHGRHSCYDCPLRMECDYEYYALQFGVSVEEEKPLAVKVKFLKIIAKKRGLDVAAKGGA